MYLMMDIEISCKGHCDSFSHFLYLVSYSEEAFKIIPLFPEQNFESCGFSIISFSPDLLLSFCFGLSLLFHSNYHDEIDKTEDIMLVCSTFTGAQLNVTYGVGFNFNTLKEGLQRNFLDGKVKCKNVPNGYTTVTQS